MIRISLIIHLFKFKQVKNFVIKGKFISEIKEKMWLKY
jgi:hypothetical protein